MALTRGVSVRSWGHLPCLGTWWTGGHWPPPGRGGGLDGPHSDVPGPGTSQSSALPSRLTAWAGSEVGRAALGAPSRCGRTSRPCPLPGSCRFQPKAESDGAGGGSSEPPGTLSCAAGALGPGLCLLMPQAPVSVTPAGWEPRDPIKYQRTARVGLRTTRGVAVPAHGDAAT